jgi:hypothetical protein
MPGAAYPGAFRFQKRAIRVENHPKTSTRISAIKSPARRTGEHSGSVGWIFLCSAVLSGFILCSPSKMITIQMIGFSIAASRITSADAVHG